MRRAIQRCSAPLLRSITPRCSSSVQYVQGITPLVAQGSLQNSSGIASFHHLSKLCQNATAAASTAQHDNPNEGLITRFDELETRNIVHSNVIRAITRDMRLETMTDVQTKTINEALHGDDIIAQARTGTGKTLAFLLPILQNIISKDPYLAQPAHGRRGPRTTADDIRALIISPTRELAEQIAEEARKLVRHTGLVVQSAVGGTQKRAGLAAIQHQGCHILVGTPGRLKDILSDPRSRVQAPDLSALVLDEADRLMDQGFWPEIQEIMHLLPTVAEKDRQTMMFSATIPKSVVEMVRATLKPGFQYVKCTRDDEVPTHERVPQRLVQCVGLENGLPALTELCSQAIEEAKQPGARPFKAIVYFNSTAEVSLASQMFRNLQGPGAEEKKDAFGVVQRRHPWWPTKIFDIHAKLTQSQRTFAADSFRNAKSAILLSSDVTARGMDFPDVTHVIQIGLPSTTEQYVHRIGRTGRAGKEGEGWLILNDIEMQEGQRRLRGLPLKRDDSLITAKLDLKQAAQVPAAAGAVLRMYQDAMRKVGFEYKAKVYMAMLGVFQWLSNKQTLVDYMNNLAQYGWGMSESPSVPHGLATRLGLLRVRGVNIEQSDARGSRGRTTDFGRDDMSDAFGSRSSFGGGSRYGSSFGGSRGGDPFGSSRRGNNNFGRQNNRRDRPDNPFGSDYQPRRQSAENDAF